MDRAMMGHMWEEEEFGVKNDHRVFFTLANQMLVQFTEMKAGGPNLHGKMTFRHVGFEVSYEISK